MFKILCVLSVLSVCDSLEEFESIVINLGDWVK